MVNIQIDDLTANFLECRARDAGVSVTEYLRSLVQATHPPRSSSWEEIETQLRAISSDGPSLPADFSRADIYADHAAIQEGLRQMDAGAGRGLKEVDAGIRAEFVFPPRP